MLVAVFDQIQTWLWDAAASPSHKALFALVSVLVSLLGLVAWHFWSFTIYPALHPGEPRPLPYWVPCDAIVGEKHTC